MSVDEPLPLPKRAHHLSVVPKELTIVVSGCEDVGKSCVSLRFTTNRFVERCDPIEDIYSHTLNLNNGKTVQLNIVDTAATEHTTSRDIYTRNGHAFVLMFSLAARYTFDEIPELWQQICRIKRDKNYEFGCVIVGNKVDLVEFRQVQKEDAIALVSSMGLTYIETSAKENTNIDDVFLSCLADFVEKNEGNLKLFPPIKRNGYCVLL